VGAHALQALTDDAVALSVCLGQRRLITLELNPMVLQATDTAQPQPQQCCCLLVHVLLMARCNSTQSWTLPYFGTAAAGASERQLHQQRILQVPGCSRGAYCAVVDLQDGFAGLL
jgi:hypothetical protein